MSLTFLTLTNEVLSRLNEIELTSSTFPTATGFHAQAKRAINSAIREINRARTEWPFNYVSTTQLLTIGTQEYDLAATTKSVDWDTFYLVGDDVLVVTNTHLPPVDYDYYVQNRRDSDLDASTTAEYSIPNIVYRPQADLKFGVSPKPNKAYTVSYQRWLKPIDMTLYTDTTTIPDDYLEIIVAGGMKYAYRFRGLLDQAAAEDGDFQKGIGEMSRVLIPQATEMRSGMLTTSILTNPTGF